jgi:hypothetical protein
MIPRSYHTHFSDRTTRDLSCSRPPQRHVMWASLKQRDLTNCKASHAMHAARGQALADGQGARKHEATLDGSFVCSCTARSS